MDSKRNHGDFYDLTVTEALIKYLGGNYEKYQSGITGLAFVFTFPYTKVEVDIREEGMQILEEHKFGSRNEFTF